MVHTLCSTTGIVVVLSLLLSIVRHAYGEGLRGVGVSEASEFIRYRISQTKLIAIPLDNLTSDQSNAAAVKPLLRPTPPDAWEVFRRDSKEKMIILRLKPGRSWLPDHYGFQETKRWPLRWYGLERNGVATEFEAPVTIGYIIEDMANVVCDDSCKTSFDGTCTDPLLLSSLDAVEGDRPSGPCAQGTDCTDCGGVEQAGIVVECDNACTSARDGVCDDNRGTGRCRAGGWIGSFMPPSGLTD